MPTPNTNKKLLQRQIPTILGLIILVVALGAGLFFFSDGLGVFAPRATPETTPKNPQLTNVSDTGFTVSFLTDDATAGFIKYGTSPNDLRSQASDDRDQLSGSVTDYTLHHITLRGLDPATQYYYVLGTGSGAEFDDNGQPFSVTTAARAGTPTAAKTIYGNVLNTSGGPAEGSIVYVSADGMGEMSSLVKSSGSWAVPLSNARTPDGSGYAQISDDDELLLFVQGPQLALTSEVAVSVAEAQPVAPITLGQNGATAAVPTSPSPSPMSSPSPVPSTSPLVSGPAGTATGGANPLTTSPSPATGSGSATSSANLSSTSSTATPSATIVDLTKTTIPTITTTQPTIIGAAAPNVSVAITVNSTTQIQQTVTADANGEFELDLSQLEEQLEPGQHTVSYTYTNPTTGQPTTTTRTFTVSPTAQLAQASTGRSTTTGTGGTSSQAQPFGSGNPVPVGGTGTGSATVATPSPSPSPSPSPTATATGSATATSSGRTSQPSTASGIPTSGSVGMTYALVIGGLFFLVTGGWSFWVSRQLKEEGNA